MTNFHFQVSGVEKLVVPDFQQVPTTSERGNLSVQKADEARCEFFLCARIFHSVTGMKNWFSKKARHGMLDVV